MASSRLKWMLLDACLVAAAFLFAYVLRFFPLSLSDLRVHNAEMRLYLQQALLVLPVTVLVRLAFFNVFRVYHGISRFTGIHDVQRIALAVTCGSAVFVIWDLATLIAPDSAFSLLAGPLRRRVPWTIVAVDWMGCLITLGGARMIRRMWSLERLNRSAAVHNVLIIGAGEVGELVARHFLSNPQMGYRPVGYIDEDETLWKRMIHGLPVLGGLRSIPESIEKHSIVEVVVATPQPSLRLLNRIVEVCEAAHVGFKIVPAVSDLMSERMSINQMRPVEIEDLLGREPVDLRLRPEMNYFKDEVVMVTGAGGSIGSELCRQILQGRPKKLLMVGRGENSIYEIATELRHDRRDDVELIIGDIRNVDRLTWIYETFEPTVVFHAAAHKHVPLMEMHPTEAVENNIIGTFNVAFLASKFGVKRFILISTDKAVRPSSVMGASKRVAEMVVSALSRESKTLFIAVRFGNVLGSRGSVVPLFRRQIAAGGPVTVTHAEVERYFMTIPEAVNLVLQAGSTNENGRLFLLDMGRPVRIAELARRMITLSGFEPGVDIDIEFTGLRPGEKLKEELLTHGEDLKPTDHPKIFATSVEQPDLETVKGWLQHLDALVELGDSEKVVEELQRIVPEFKPAPSRPAPTAPSLRPAAPQAKAAQPRAEVAPQTRPRGQTAPSPSRPAAAAAKPAAAPERRAPDSGGARPSSGSAPPAAAQKPAVEKKPAAPARPAPSGQTNPSASRLGGASRPPGKQ